MTFLICSQHFRSNPHHEFEKYLLKKSVWWRCDLKLGTAALWGSLQYLLTRTHGSVLSAGFGFEGTIETSKWHQSWNSLNCCLSLSWHQTRECCAVHFSWCLVVFRMGFLSLKESEKDFINAFLLLLLLLYANIRFWLSRLEIQIPSQAYF